MWSKLSPFFLFFVHRQRALILEHYYIRYSPTCALLCIEVYLQCTLKAMCIFSMHRFFCRKIIMIFIFFTVKKGKLLLHFAKNGLSTASTPSNLQRRTDSESDFHHRSLTFTLNLSLSCASGCDRLCENKASVWCYVEFWSPKAVILNLWVGQGHFECQLENLPFQIY